MSKKKQQRKRKKKKKRKKESNIDYFSDTLIDFQLKRPNLFKYHVFDET